ncbi:hypothetical protein GE061_010375 [Apolygus lucorum]|uniref:Uncharacterized protein n=1 Tax=Apolygus lucorum TaxID=248454 RepID=A0A8S9Y4D8_APOLU|nr:hypothetical protein GE061_010375 [Apolygus lucorum]
MKVEGRRSRTSGKTNEQDKEKLRLVIMKVALFIVLLSLSVFLFADLIGADYLDDLEEEAQSMANKIRESTNAKSSWKDKMFARLKEFREFVSKKVPNKLRGIGVKDLEAKAKEMMNNLRKNAKPHFS